MVFNTLAMNTTAQDTRFLVANSRPGTGLGLFATEPIQKGDFILQYTGVPIPTSIADESESRYLFEVDDHITLDGDTEDNTAKYINHDCHPNTEADVVGGKILIHALRDIAVGEELTIDYDTEYFDEFIRPIGCRCASCERGLVSPHCKLT